MMYQDVVKFIEELSISDDAKNTLKKEFSAMESLINKASEVLLEKYPSLKFQGYSADQVIDIAAEKCFK